MTIAPSIGTTQKSFSVVKKKEKVQELKKQGYINLQNRVFQDT